jgi:hypothetical protein
VLVVVHQDNLVVVIRALLVVVLDIHLGPYKAVLVRVTVADLAVVLVIGVVKVVLIFVVLLLLVAVEEAHIFTHQ